MISVKDRTFSEILRKKTQRKTLCKYVQCKLTPRWTVVLAKPLYHDSFQLSRKRLYVPQGDMTLEKGLRSQHSKDIQLHDSLGSPTRFLNQKGLNLQLAIGLGELLVFSVTPYQNKNKNRSIDKVQNLEKERR
mgnify:CR=1 FL=1